jgi:hypothetical protein
MPREDRPLDRREPRRDPLRVEPPNVVLGEPDADEPDADEPDAEPDAGEPPEVEGNEGADEEGTAAGAAARPQTVQ